MPRAKLQQLSCVGSTISESKIYGIELRKIGGSRPNHALLEFLKLRLFSRDSIDAVDFNGSIDSTDSINYEDSIYSIF